MGHGFGLGSALGPGSSLRRFGGCGLWRGIGCRMCAVEFGNFGRILRTRLCRDPLALGGLLVLGGIRSSGKQGGTRTAPGRLPLTRLGGVGLRDGGGVSLGSQGSGDILARGGLIRGGLIGIETSVMEGQWRLGSEVFRRRGG